MGGRVRRVTKHGHILEDDVEELLRRCFLKDSVIRSPRVVFGRGKPEELADFLLIARETVFVFQVKSRVIPCPPSQMDEIDRSRVAARVSEAIRQCNTALRAIRNKSQVSLVNARGVIMDGHLLQATKVVGIVVVRLEGEPVGDPAHFAHSVVVQRGMPIHVFKWEDFISASELNDTPTDLADYLNTRHKLNANNTLHPLTREMDLLMAYKTRWPEVQSAASGANNLMVIEPGYAEEFLQTRREELMRRSRRLRRSYLIDEIVATAHSSIGFNLASEAPALSGLTDPGSREDYIEVFTLLSQLSRLERQALAEKLIEKANRAQQVGVSYGLISSDGGRGPWILLVCHSGDRAARMTKLVKLAGAAVVQAGVRRVIGIATEAAGSPGRSYDFVIADTEHLTTAEREQLLSPPLFKPPVHWNIQEWQ